MYSVDTLGHSFIGANEAAIKDCLAFDTLPSLRFLYAADIAAANTSAVHHVRAGLVAAGKSGDSTWDL